MFYFIFLIERNRHARRVSRGTGDKRKTWVNNYIRQSNAAAKDVGLSENWREVAKLRKLLRFHDSKRRINYSDMRIRDTLPKRLLRVANKAHRYFTFFPSKKKKNSYFRSDWYDSRHYNFITHCARAQVCGNAYVYYVRRFIWSEHVGNIYDLAFTAKLTLIWSRALIYELT